MIKYTRNKENILLNVSGKPTEILTGMIVIFKNALNEQVSKDWLINEIKKSESEVEEMICYSLIFGHIEEEATITYNKNGGNIKANVIDVISLISKLIKMVEEDFDISKDEQIRMIEKFSGDTDENQRIDQ